MDQARQHRVKADGADVGGHVRQPERPWKIAEVFKEIQRRRPLRQQLFFVRAKAGGDEVLRLPVSSMVVITP